MSILLIIAVLVLGGSLAWVLERWGEHWPRWISLASLTIAAAVLWSICAGAGDGLWWLAVSIPWVPRFGIQFEFAVDGLSATLLWLTLLLGYFSILVSWSEINKRIGFFHFNLLAVLAGVVGVFTALDLMLFFVFWEIMLLPMVLLIAIWGHENRVYAAIKFFIFTQASSLLLLLSIVVLAWLNAQASGQWSFSYSVLLNTPLSETAAWWCMLGFFIAFVVKLPAVPVHTWLPDAHTQAPTAGSVLLAALLLKTGAYGLIRFTLPLFPEASHQLAPFAMAVGVLGILYGAKLAFAQHDMKRLVAYSSISHMGFVLLGIYAFNALALRGAVVQMVAHGLSTAALFALAGMLQERLHSRDLRQMGGLWVPWPRLGAFILIFAVASLGLPGLANFVAEFLVLLGVFSVQPWFAVAASLGLIVAVVYSLILVQKTIWGERNSTLSTQAENKKAELHSRDANGRELTVLTLLLLALIYFGLQPQALLKYPAPTLANVLQRLQIADTPSVPVIEQGIKIIATGRVEP